MFPPYVNSLDVEPLAAICTATFLLCSPAIVSEAARNLIPISLRKAVLFFADRVDENVANCDPAVCGTIPGDSLKAHAA